MKKTGFNDFYTNCKQLRNYNYDLDQVKCMTVKFPTRPLPVKEGKADSASETTIHRQNSLTDAVV